MPNIQQSNTSHLFLRKSSGLVKIAGFWDVFIYNMGLISVGIGVAYTQRYGPAYYSGSSIVIASLLATILMLAIGFALWFWTVTISRSGGIYVFLTRGANPALGFALSFVECISWLFYVAVAATLINDAGFIPMLALLTGTQSKAVSWLITPLAHLIVGTVAIMLPALLLITGTRRYFIVQKLFFLVATLGTIVLLFVLFAAPASELFRTKFNSLHSEIGSLPYNLVVAQARSGGWKGDIPISFAGSIPLLVWPFLALIGGAFSIAIGGEVKNTIRNQLFGILGSILLSGALFVGIAIGADRAFGTDFQGAIAYNFDKNYPSSEQYTTPFPPYLSYLAGIAAHNTFLGILISIGFICWVYFWIPGVISYVERAFLAWSLDRIGPSILAKLHDRWGTPYVAILLAAFVAELFLFFYLYTTFFATLVFILAAALAWCITLIVGAVFPYRATHIYRSSEVARFRIRNLPLMTIACSLGTIGLAYVIYLLWNDSLAAGHSPKSLITVASLFLLGIVIFLVVKRLRRRAGISFDLIYKEIPVE